MRRSCDDWKHRFKQHILMRGLSPRTADDYTAELGPLFGFLEERGAPQLVSVTRDDLDAYRQHLYTLEFRGKRLGMGAQARRIRAVKSFFAYLTDEAMLLVNPASHLRHPKVPRTVPRLLLSEGETEKLLGGSDITTPLGIRNRTIMELLYATAIRNTELRELELGDIDLERQELFVARGKGNKSRRLPLGEEAAAWLEDYLSNARPVLAVPVSGDLVFLSAGGRQLDRGRLSIVVRNTASACGLDKRVTPHLLRHCCATHMLRRGAGVRQLQALLGHANLGTTQRYTQIDIGDLHKTVSKYHPREQGFGLHGADGLELS
jgi:integrase/recombinase XerD